VPVTSPERGMVVVASHVGTPADMAKMNPLVLGLISDMTPVLDP
jgi:hypothetical protein